MSPNSGWRGIADCCPCSAISARRFGDRVRRWRTETFLNFFGYTYCVLTRKPALRAGQDMRDLPTYAVPEAARFLGIPERTLRSWFSGANPVLTPSGSAADQPLLSFRNLVDAHIVHTARVYHDLPMSRNPRRRASKQLKERATPSTPSKIGICGFSRDVWFGSSLGTEGESAPSLIFRCGGRPASRKLSISTQSGFQRDVTLAFTVALFPWRFWRDRPAKPPGSNQSEGDVGPFGRPRGTRIPVKRSRPVRQIGRRTAFAIINSAQRVVREALSHFDTKAA